MGRSAHSLAMRPNAAESPSASGASLERVANVEVTACRHVSAGLQLTRCLGSYQATTATAQTPGSDLAGIFTANYFNRLINRNQLCLHLMVSHRALNESVAVLFNECLEFVV